jgi:hypothetical protein
MYFFRAVYFMALLVPQTTTQCVEKYEDKRTDKSKLSTNNKLLIYKTILKPIWTLIFPPLFFALSFLRGPNEE